MCIICNGGSSNEAVTAASQFLTAWGRSVEAMRDASRALLTVSEVMPVKADRERYDALHKRMVRLMHDWNRLEMERESAPEEGQG